MRYRICAFVLWVGMFLCPRRLPALTYTAADSLRVVEWLSEAGRQPRGTDLTLFFAGKFVGTPYVAATLEVNPTEELVVNLRELDCTTFVENVVALTLTARGGQPDFAAFCRNLEKVRYRSGRLDGYSSRNHYFSQWIESNERLGIVREVGGRPEDGFRPFTAVQRLSLNYMSTHPERYPMLRKHPADVARIRRQEQALSGREVRFVPLALLDESEELRKVISDGDILAIVTKKKGLDTSHIGFAVWQDGELHLLNASSLHRKVVLEPMTLSRYMKKHPSQSGVRVVRIL